MIFKCNVCSTQANIKLVNNIQFKSKTTTPVHIEDKQKTIENNLKCKANVNSKLFKHNKLLEKLVCQAKIKNYLCNQREKRQNNWVVVHCQRGF